MDNISQAYLQKILQMQTEASQKPLTTEELKQIAFDSGLNQEAWEAIQDTFKAHFERGEGFLRHGNLEDAISELEQASIINPYNIECLEILSEAYEASYYKNFDQHHGLKAYKLAQRCLQIDPSHDPSLRLISHLKQDPSFKKTLNSYDPKMEYVRGETKPTTAERISKKTIVLVSSLALGLVIGLLSYSVTKKQPLQQEENSGSQGTVQNGQGSSNYKDNAFKSFLEEENNPQGTELPEKK